MPIRFSIRHPIKSIAKIVRERFLPPPPREPPQGPDFFPPEPPQGPGGGVVPDYGKPCGVIFREEPRGESVPVIMTIRTSDELSIAGSWYGVVGRYLQGGDMGAHKRGSYHRGASYYADRIRSFEGETVSGHIIDGPPEWLNQDVEDVLIEWDPRRIRELVDRIDELDLLGDENTPGS